MVALNICPLLGNFQTCIIWINGSFEFIVIFIKLVMAVLSAAIVVSSSFVCLKVVIMYSC